MPGCPSAKRLGMQQGSSFRVNQDPHKQLKGLYITKSKGGVQNYMKNHRSNIRLIPIFLCVIIIISQIAGCSSLSKDVLKELKDDPNNPELLEDAARFCYEKERYGKAYKHYKKLLKLKAIDDEQKYRMYVSGTRTKYHKKESWKEISSMRNTGHVQYTKLSCKGEKFQIPEHWIGTFMKGNKKKGKGSNKSINNNIIESLNMPNAPYKEMRRLVNKQEFKDNYELYYLSIGPGFILKLEGRSDFVIPRTDEITSEKAWRWTITRSVPKKAIDSIFSVLNDLLSENVLFEDKIIDDIDYYYYKPLNQKGTKFKKIKYDTSKRKMKNSDSLSYGSDYLEGFALAMKKNIDDSIPHIGCMIWNQRPKNVEKDFSSGNLVNAVFIKLNYYYNYSIKAHAIFEEKYKEEYFKELERFILNKSVLLYE